MKFLALLPVLALALALTPAAADWRQFRGNDSNSVAEDSAGPESLNVLWKADLPGRGLSGPIVTGHRLVLTSSSGPAHDRLHVHCFDAHTGKPLWERQFWATGRTGTHPKICAAAPTPASDGERIFAFYSSNDLVCLDLDGNLLWYRGLGSDYPNATNSLGMASSPLVVDETLIVQMETDDDALALGIDVDTGLERWRLDRPSSANWTSPIALPGPNGGNRVLIQGTDGLTALDPETGKRIWTYDDGASSMSSSVLADGTIYVPSHGITALQPPLAPGEHTGGSADVDRPKRAPQPGAPPGNVAPKILWREGRLGPSTISPLVHDGRLYSINSAGVLNCADAPTGKTLWQLRLKSPFTSSPIAAAGRLYVFNEEGLAQIVDVTGERGQIAGEYALGETILCTPALSDGAIYIRSDSHVWKLGDTAK